MLHYHFLFPCIFLQQYGKLRNGIKSFPFQSPGEWYSKSLADVCNIWFHYSPIIFHFSHIISYHWADKKEENWGKQYLRGSRNWKKALMHDIDRSILITEVNISEWLLCSRHYSKIATWISSCNSNIIWLNKYYYYPHFLD